MKGYVARRAIVGMRSYTRALTRLFGKERRRWHPDWTSGKSPSGWQQGWLRR
jgi:hypothetical protein